VELDETLVTKEKTMRLDKFIEGLNTLKPYYTDPNGFHIGAEHDQFYAYATDKPLSAADVQKMCDLGWFQPEQDEGAPYEPENGWSAFT
jgi:hypothetical protein